MKKLIFGVGLVLTVSVINLFNACSADEAEEAYMEQTSKKELLLAKSKEFAKKYGVDMEIRKDMLDELAQSISIEEMERDYKEVAKNKQKTITFKLDIVTPKQKRKNLKFRSTTTVTEIEEQRDTIYKGNAKKEGLELQLNNPDYNKYGTCRYYNLNGNMTVEWQYGNKIASFAKYSIDFTVNDGQEDGFSCSGILNANFSTSPFRFDGSDRCSVLYKYYTYYILVYVSYDGSKINATLG